MVTRKASPESNHSEKLSVFVHSASTCGARKEVQNVSAHTQRAVLLVIPNASGMEAMAMRGPAQASQPWSQYSPSGDD